MNVTTALKGTASRGGPIILSAGIAMLAVALTVPGNTRYPAQTAPPGPQPTVTVTATPAEQTPAPRPSPSRTAQDRMVVAAEPAARSAAPGGGLTATGMRRDGSRSRTGGPGSGSSGGSETSPPAAPSRCQGTVLAVGEPLGVLPRCGITIGGSR